MTGGSLPAMTFKKIMDYAHQGIVLKPIPGIADPFPAPKPESAKTQTVAAKKPEPGAEPAPPPLVRPRTLSATSTTILRGIGEELKDAPPLNVQKVATAE